MLNNIGYIWQSVYNFVFTNPCIRLTPTCMESLVQKLKKRFKTNVHRVLGPWHKDARTNMFFCAEKSYWKITHGRGEQASKTWQKRKCSMIYKNLYRSKHLKQANTAIIFG